MAFVISGKFELTHEEAVRSLRAVKRGQDEVAKSSKKVGAANKIAAGHVGNLTAQFNDIAMMTMAGQNPLMMAVQQGTQITQVIGPMGAGGAVKALGSAFMAMINPLSLFTLGSIAAGGAMVGWLSGALGGSVSLEEGLSDLSKELDVYAKAVKEAGQPTAELEAKFGGAADEAREMLERIADAKFRKLEFKIEGTIEAAIDETGLDFNSFRLDDRIKMGNEFELNFGYGVNRRRNKELIDEMIGDYDAMAKAADGSTAEQIAALDTMIKTYERAAQASGEVTAEENARLETYLQLSQELRELEALEAKRAQSTMSPQIKALGQYQNTRADSDAENAAAREQLNLLNQENTVLAAIIRHGEKSAEVTALRQQAERLAFDETLATMEVSQDLKDELRAAFEKGLDLAELDMASGVRAAASEAQKLATELGIALSAALEMTKITPAMADEDLAMSMSVLPDADQRETNRRSVVNFGRLTKPRSGGAAKIDAERDALEKLFSQEQLQIDLLRATDPVQKELMRNREALASATDAERQALAALIEERMAEEDTLKNRDFWLDTAYQSILDLTKVGADFEDIMRNIGLRIAEAGLEASLLGTGPLAKLFGTSGSGGLLGTLFNTVTDAVVAMPASAPLAPPVNSLSSMAAPALPSPAPQAAQPTVVHIVASSEFNAMVDRRSANTAVEVVTGFERDVLPGSVQRIIRNPRDIG